jgi:crotonobetainyl-CoA:carnitine CoA-transferase CaiB-like acyl-CoA transferase
MCSLATLGELFGDADLAQLHAFDDRDIVKCRIDTHTSRMTSEALLELLKSSDVWCAPVRDSAEAMQELQTLGSDRLIELDHPEAGTVKAIACPIGLSGTPTTRKEAAPTVGQHTDAVLAELIDEERLNTLRADGAVA